MVFPLVSSQPLPVRGGNGCSSKRPVSARGVSTGSKLSSSSNYGFGLSDAVERGLGPDALMKHFSASQKRSLRSSPTDSSCGGAEARASCEKPRRVLFGFDVNGEADNSSVVEKSAQPSVACSEDDNVNGSFGRAKGLLSRAFSDKSAEAIADSSSVAPLDKKECLSFPEVDTTLLKDLQERHVIFRTELVQNAYMLAAKAHHGRFRKDKTSQLSHSVMVGLRLAEIGLDAECVAAGLLHEVLRENSSLVWQMEEFMPSSVVQLVNRVTVMTELSHLYRNNRDRLTDDKWRRMLLAMEDVKTVLIKLACRVHNMKSASVLPREKQISLAQESLDIFSVVANRLGIWCLKAELEDLAFSILHPEEFQVLSSQVAQRQDSEALSMTIQKIKAGLDARGVHYEDISGRPKSLYGIWYKMKDSGYTSLDQVYDVTALRVVVSNKHDCYAALRVVQEIYRTIPSRSKDFIKDIKKPNGYQSLHETIYGERDFPVEVQFRTHKMHYIAEYGFAAHWKYKEKLSNEDEWLDKEIQYKKWLTQYKLGVCDKKVKPTGAPSQDTALKSLGIHLLDRRSEDGSVDDFGVDPFLRHDRFKLQAPCKQSVDVVLQTQDSIDTRQLPLGYTVAQLERALRVQLLPDYVMTVNQRVPAPDAKLHNADLVQVLPAKQVLRDLRFRSGGVPKTPHEEVVVLHPDSPVPVRVCSSVPKMSWWDAGNVARILGFGRGGGNGYMQPA